MFIAKASALNLLSVWASVVTFVMGPPYSFVSPSSPKRSALVPRFRSSSHDLVWPWFRSPHNEPAAKRCGLLNRHTSVLVLRRHIRNRQFARKKLLLHCDIYDGLVLLRPQTPGFLVCGLVISGNS